MVDDAFPAIARRALDASGHEFTDAFVERVGGLEEVVLARIAEDLLVQEWNGQG